MSRKAKSSNLLGKFRILLKNTSVLATGTRETREMVSLRNSYGRNNALLGWARQPYLETIDAIHQMCPNISEMTIRKELERSIIRLFEQHAVSERSDPQKEAHFESILDIMEETAIQTELDNLLDLLKNKVKSHTVFVPLTGLILRIPSLAIGEVIIYPNGSGPLLSVMQNRRLVTEDEEKEFRTKEGCYAVVSNLEGDTKYAQEVAQAKISPVVDVLNVLNLYLASCRDRRRGFAKISIGKHHHDTIEVYTASESGGQSFSGSLLSHRDYEVYPDTIEQWKEWEFDEVTRCCLGDEWKPGTIESRVKRAITWYSKAVNADGIEEQVVALATALESLLVGKNETGITTSWGSITQKLADRAAFLLGSSYEDRIEISQIAKELYESRSRIVHTGEPISPENLDRMNSLVRGVIFIFAHRKFKSWDDFLEWIKKQTYTTPDDTSSP